MYVNIDVVVYVYLYMICICIHMCICMCKCICIFCIRIYDSTRSKHVHTERYRHAIDAVLQSRDSVALCDSIFISIHLIHVCIHLWKSYICKYIFCKTIPYKLIYKFTCIHIFTYIDHRYLYTKWVHYIKPLHQLQYVPPTKFARQRCHQWCH